MRAIGIVRNMDDLGRLVIPKSLRENMRIDKGDPIEFFTDGEMIVLKRYSSIHICSECGQSSDKLIGKTRICSKCLDMLSLQK